jgi:hypothetical protein
VHLLLRDGATFLLDIACMSLLLAQSIYLLHSQYTWLYQASFCTGQRTQHSPVLQVRQKG